MNNEKELREYHTQILKQVYGGNITSEEMGYSTKEIVAHIISTSYKFNTSGQRFHSLKARLESLLTKRGRLPVIVDDCEKIRFIDVSPHHNSKNVLNDYFQCLEELSEGKLNLYGQGILNTNLFSMPDKTFFKIHIYDSKNVSSSFDMKFIINKATIDKLLTGSDKKLYYEVESKVNRDSFTFPEICAKYEGSPEIDANPAHNA